MAPRALLLLQCVLQPRFLFFTQHLPLGVVEIIFKKRLHAAGPLDAFGVIELLVAAHQARVEHNEVGEVTDLKRAVDHPLIALGPGADRHPLVVGLPGGVNALKEIPLAFVVVLGPRAPGVVHHLVVIPHRDPRVRRVGGE